MQKNQQTHKEAAAPLKSAKRPPSKPKSRKKPTKVTKPSLHQKLRPLLSHPWVAVVPIVALLWLGWQQYLAVSRPVNVSAQNLLQGGSFQKLETNGLPTGWQLLTNSEAKVTTGSINGYVKGKGLGMYVHNYKSGDITLRSPKVTVTKDKKYLFKGYYQTTADFDLLLRKYFKDGSTTLEFVREYPANNDPWSTVSYAFQATEQLQAVAFEYRLTSNGDLKIDDTYIEQKETGIYIPSKQPEGPNLIPNADVRKSVSNKPSDWVTFAAGNNKPNFIYTSVGTLRALQTTISDYKDGEAKWQYLPLSVVPGQAFTFSVSHQGTTKAEVIAEYELEDGTRKYDTALTLKPASSPTTYTTEFEAPRGAKNMFVSVVLHSNGTATTTNYSLQEVTKQSHTGSRKFNRPLVSLTFDDGWQSAYTTAAKMMDGYDYRGTFYLNSATVDTGIFMNKKQLEDLTYRGHQIASHGDDHIDMTSLSTAKLRKELKSTYDYIEKTFGLASQDFAAPFGKTDPEVQWQTRQFYRSQRGTSTGLNTKQNFDPYDLKVLFITKDTPLAVVKNALNEAHDYNGWLILAYHRIEHKTTSSTTITPEDFRQQLELLQQSHTPVVTVEQALNEIQEQQ